MNGTLPISVFFGTYVLAFSVLAIAAWRLPKRPGFAIVAAAPLVLALPAAALTAAVQIIVAAFQ